MAKAHRGRPLKAEQSGGGRGKCPVCQRTGIKVVYVQKHGELSLSTCKQCKVAIARGKAAKQLAALAAA